MWTVGTTIFVMPQPRLKLLPRPSPWGITEQRSTDPGAVAFPEVWEHLGELMPSGGLHHGPAGHTPWGPKAESGVQQADPGPEGSLGEVKGPQGRTTPEGIGGLQPWAAAHTVRRAVSSREPLGRTWRGLRKSFRWGHSALGSHRAISREHGDATASAQADSAKDTDCC